MGYLVFIRSEIFGVAHAETLSHASRINSALSSPTAVLGSGQSGLDQSTHLPTHLRAHLFASVHRSRSHGFRSITILLQFVLHTTLGRSNGEPPHRSPI